MTPSVTRHDDELVIAALTGDDRAPGGWQEFDVLVFDADGFCHGDPGFSSLDLAIAAGVEALEADPEWVRAEVRTTKVPDGRDWPALVTITP